MRFKWKSWLKSALAVIVALAALDLFCAWFYNPAAYMRDEFRATDVVREPGAFTSRATEGFGSMRMDANGYNNAAVPDENGVFVLMMGSSHVEGMNVAQDENVAARLGALLEKEKGCVYNIGMSSHVFTRNAGNFERAVERFRPSGYVVMELSGVILQQSEVERAMRDEVYRMSATNVRLPRWLSARPLLRRLYRQWQSLIGGKDPFEEDEAPYSRNATAEQLALYRQTLAEWFSAMNAAAERYGARLIIYYHPHLLLQKDGSAVPDTDEDCLKAFAAACDDAGVIFLDMTDSFMETYERERILPHGFSNTLPGVGHLNRYGHDQIARRLYAIIMEEEAKQ